jgi:hypothetical protein
MVEKHQPYMHGWHYCCQHLHRYFDGALLPTALGYFLGCCHRFLFKDQYIEFTTNIPEDADLYGLGEVTLPTGFLLPRNGKTITMWARDFPCAFPDVNLYGSHPFYLQVNKGGWGWGHNGRVVGAWNQRQAVLGRRTPNRAGGQTREAGRAQQHVR